MKINNIEETQVAVYSCGSQRLSHEIRTQLGMIPINVYKHKKSGKIINVYVMTNELSQFLRKWSENNPHKKVVRNDGKG